MGSKKYSLKSLVLAEVWMTTSALISVKYIISLCARVRKNMGQKYCGGKYRLDLTRIKFRSEYNR
jgi:hypothetical protein